MICAVVVAAVSAVLLVGPAYAWFTSSGIAAGRGSSASGLASFTTTAEVPSGALLYPGGVAAPLTVNVNNSSNSYALLVTAISLDGSRSVVVDTAHVSTCTVPALSVSTPGAWSGIAVSAHASSGAMTIPAAVSMGLTASTGCQGATFTVPVILTGRNT